MTAQVHDAVLVFSKTWGAIYLLSVFVLATFWTYWPSRKSIYDKAQQSPLQDEDCQR